MRRTPRAAGRSGRRGRLPLSYPPMSDRGNEMIQTEEIQYACGGATLRGLLAVNPEAKGRRPAVLAVHEWWGRGEYVEKRARMLAGAGYAGFAIDLYGEGPQAEAAEQAKAAVN